MGNHSPEPSSVANSMEPLIKELAKKYSIDLVTNRKRVNFKSVSNTTDLNIYRVDGVDFYIFHSSNIHT